MIIASELQENQVEIVCFLVSMKWVIYNWRHGKCHNNYPSLKGFYEIKKSYVNTHVVPKNYVLKIPSRNSETSFAR